MTLTKRIIGASSLVALASIFARALSILSAPILTALLGPESYGDMALIATLISLGSILGMSGIDLSYTRYGLKDGSVNSLVADFCWRFAYIVGILLAVLLVVFSYFWLADSMQMSFIWFVIAAITLYFSILEKMAQTRRRLSNQYGLIAASIAASAIIAVGISVLLAIHWRRDVWPLLLGALAAPLINVVILRLHIPMLERTSLKLDKSKMKELLMFGITGAAISAPLYWIITSSDRWFIGVFIDTYSVGVYSFAYNISILGLMINSSLLVAWRTEVTRDFESDPNRGKEVLGALWGKFVLLLSLVWLAIVAAGGDVIRLLADESFHDGIVILPWVAGGVLFYGISHLTSISLILKGNMMPFAQAHLFSAIVCLVLNFLLIPKLGIIGAAVSQFIAFIINAIYVYIAANRILPLTFDKFRLGLLMMIISLMGLMFFPSWSNNPAISLILKFPLGVISSFVLLYMFSPDWIRKGFSIIVNNKYIKG